MGAKVICGGCKKNAAHWTGHHKGYAAKFCQCTRCNRLVVYYYVNGECKVERLRTYRDRIMP